MVATAFYAWRPGVLGPLLAGLAAYLPLRLAWAGERCALPTPTSTWHWISSPHDVSSLLAAAPRQACTLASADDSAAWAALHSDGAVALVRHAEAPGVGDPPGWKLDDCATQRNLDDAGRAQARALGARLKAERIPVRRLLASPWCRTIETATLLGVGTVQPEPTFANAFVLSDGAASSAPARAP